AVGGRRPHQMGVRQAERTGQDERCDEGGIKSFHARSPAERYEWIRARCAGRPRTVPRRAASRGDATDVPSGLTTASMRFRDKARTRVALHNAVAVRYPDRTSLRRGAEHGQADRTDWIRSRAQ